MTLESPYDNQVLSTLLVVEIIQLNHTYPDLDDCLI